LVVPRDEERAIRQKQGAPHPAEGVIYR